MELVLDANVFFRILISQGEIMGLVFNQSIFLFAPERMREEFEKHRTEIMSKSALSDEDFDNLFSMLSDIIEFVSIDEYASFIPKAKELLRGHDKDEDFIALCMYKNCKLWTYELRLLKLGFGVTTKPVSELLQQK